MIESTWPVNIPLQERVLLDGGVMFVVLPTLDELAMFWEEHKQVFSYACQGIEWENPQFLRGCEWVFGNSKASVIRSVLRWGKSCIGCEFYDWYKHDNGQHDWWFEERDDERNVSIIRGQWSTKDEAAYLADCKRRTPESYRGWWQFCNIPDGREPNDWFNPSLDPVEIIDPNMPIREVEDILHEQTFDDWKASDVWEIEAHDQESIEETIRYWCRERADGRDYYGCVES
jgi:hypothetical protein